MPLDLVIIGCGSRGRGHARIAAEYPERYRIVGGADPDPVRVADVAKLAKGKFSSFASADECLKAGRLGDVAVVATQDVDHVAPTIRALELGYHVFLEKPIARTPADVLAVLSASERTGRRVIVCHNLRFAPLQERIQELLLSGAIGDLVAIDHIEGVDPFHQAHSFVRGHWAVAARSNPMILAKSCHDMDIMSWWAGRPCRRVSSFGSLHHFTAANAPQGATARCTDGCPHVGKCHYDAHRYVTDMRSWLAAHDEPLATTGTREEILAYLRTSPLGRCAYRCDNDVVDRQVVSLEFDGGLLATFTMTAFEHGRHTVVRGTKGVLRAGVTVKELSGHQIEIRRFNGGRDLIDWGSSDGHGGGDEGIIAALDHELALPDPRQMRTGIHASVESHLMALAAERSRLAGGQVVSLDDLRANPGVAEQAGAAQR